MYPLFDCPYCARKCQIEWPEDMHWVHVACGRCDKPMWVMRADDDHFVVMTEDSFNESFYENAEGNIDILAKPNAPYTETLQ